MRNKNTLKLKRRHHRSRTPSSRTIRRHTKQQQRVIGSSTTRVNKTQTVRLRTTGGQLPVSRSFNNNNTVSSTITVYTLNIMITTNSAATGGKDAKPQQFKRSMLYLTEEMKAITRARDNDTSTLIQGSSSSAAHSKTKIAGGSFIGQLDLNRISDLPYFTMDYEYPVAYLEKLPYQARVNFFFIRTRFLKGIKKYGIKTNNRNENARHNIMHMLRLLFPTTIIVADNQIDSNKVYVQRKQMHLQGSNFGRALAQTSSRAWVANSYLKLSDGNIYTIAKVVWQNDVLNHPIYRNLINECLEFMEWCEKQRTFILGDGHQEGELTKLKHKLTETLLKQFAVKYQPGDIVTYKDKMYSVKSVNIDYSLNLVKYVNTNNMPQRSFGSGDTIMHVPWEEVGPDKGMFGKMMKKSSSVEYRQSFALIMKEEFIHILQNAFYKYEQTHEPKRGNNIKLQSDKMHSELANIIRGVEYFRQLDYLLFKPTNAPTSQPPPYNFKQDYENYIDDYHDLTDSTYGLRESYGKGMENENIIDETLKKTVYTEIETLKSKINPEREKLDKIEHVLTDLVPLKNIIDMLLDNKVFTDSLKDGTLGYFNGHMNNPATTVSAMASDTVSSVFASAIGSVAPATTTATAPEKYNNYINTMRVIASVLLQIFARFNFKKHAVNNNNNMTIRDTPLTIIPTVNTNNNNITEYINNLPSFLDMQTSYADMLKNADLPTKDIMIKDIFTNTIAYINDTAKERETYKKHIDDLDNTLIDIEREVDIYNTNHRGNSAYDYIMLTRRAYLSIKTQLDKSPHFLNKLLDILDNILIVITAGASSILDSNVSRNFNTFIKQLTNESKNVRVFDEIAHNYLDIRSVNPKFEDISKDNTNPVLHEIFQQLKTENFAEYKRFTDTLKQYTNPVRVTLTNAKLQNMIDNFVMGLRPRVNDVHLTEFMQRIKSDFVEGPGKFEKQVNAMNDLTYVGVNRININKSSESAAQIFLQFELIQGVVTDKTADNISCAYKDAQLASEVSSLFASHPSWQSSIPGYIMDARPPPPPPAHPPQNKKKSK